MTRLAPRPFAAAVSGALLALALPGALAASEVTGRVTDESENPIAGARVTLHPVDTGAALGTRWLEGEPYAEAVADTRTGDDGSYRLDAPDDGRLFWTVVVRARGRVPMEQDVGPLFGAVHLEPVGLAEDTGTVVRVLEAGGTPAVGATVLFAAAPGTPLLGGRRGGWFPGAFRTARTGPDGRARVPRAEGEGGEVAVVAPGRLARATLASTRLRVSLPPVGGPGSRTLLTTGPDGEPVAGAVVWGPAELVPPQARVTARMGRFPLAVTGEDGTAVVPAAALAAQPPVGLYVEATSGLRAHVEIEPPTPPGDPEPGGERAPATAPPVPVRLAPPDVIAGRVEEHGGGGPVAGAVVWTRGGAADAVRSDGSGRFALPVPAVERIMLAAAGPAHQAPAWERVELAAPDRGEPVLVLDPTISLVGRVEDEAGGPIAGAVVEALPREEYSFGGGRKAERRRVLTDESGRFRADGIAFETLYSVVATLDGFAPGRAEVPPVPRDPETGVAAVPEVTIVLPLGQRLVGRVVDPAGAPVAGAEVRYLHVDDEDDWLPHQYAEAKTTSGPEGELSLAHVIAGIGNLSIQAPGFAPFERTGIEVPAEPGVTDLGALELEPEVFLEVVVVDGDGDPVAGAAIGVTWRSSGPFGLGMSRTETPAEARTDEAGRFRKGGFAPGQVVDVSASQEGFAPTSVDRIRLPDASPVRVVLEAGAIVSGRVVDEAGRPVAEAVVMPEMSDPSSHRLHMLHMQSDEDGRFELGGLPAGPVKLAARTRDGDASPAVLLELASGERREDVELTIRPEPVVRVRVYRSTGEPAARPTVFAHSVDERFGTSCSPAPSGELLCKGLGPGSYRMTAIEEGFGRADRDLQVGAEGGEVDLHLEPAIEIAGRVETADGAPAPARMVMLSSERETFPPFHEATTAADGSFAFRGVENGTYRITVSTSRGSRWLGPGAYQHPEEVVVAGGASVRGLVVRLDEDGSVAGRLLGLEPDEVGTVSVAATGPAGAEGQHPVPGRVLSDGRYQIAGLAPGTWRVEARSAESGKRGDGEVEVGAGEALLDLDLRRGLVLSGTLRAGGEPWSGVSVSIPSELVHTQADAQGRFRLAGLEPGTYELILHERMGTVSIRREVRLEEDREIVIEVELGQVRGTVLSAVGLEPIAGAQITLVRTTDEERWNGRSTTSAVDGRFLLDRIPADAYVIEVEAPGHRPTAAELRVGEGETTLPPVVLQPEVE